MFLRLRSHQSGIPRNDCEQFGMQGTVGDFIIDIDKLAFSGMKSINLLFKKSWEEISQELVINANCNKVMDKLG